MPEDISAGEEHGPHEDQPDRKRRRKALSCIDCKRRKLKCDRVFPSCGRCARAGLANRCSYTSYSTEGLDSDNRETTNEQYREFPGFMPKATSPHPPPERSNQSSAKNLQTADDFLNKLRTQEDRIRQLEDKLASVDRGQGLLPLYRNELFDRSHDQSSSYSGLLRGIITKRNVSGTDGDLSDRADTMVFRGKGFKTQFYGPSNPASLHDHVGSVSTIKSCR